MANKVYANGREVACKAAAGKSIAAFPDVCLSPPTPPAGPVPIPYPNTAMASDTDQGSKTVQISGQEVMLKDSSCFKKSSGDEAATKSLGMGVVTHQIQGKAYFNSWSMDVKIEGENAVRHLDLTTHNHASFPGNSPPWVYADSMAAGGDGSGTSTPVAACKDEVAEADKKCDKRASHAAQCKDAACRNAKRCLLVTYNQGKRGGKTTRVGCCEGEEPHHLVEAHCFYESGERGSAEQLFVKPAPGKSAYKDDDAPCVCAKGPREAKEHGRYHAVQQGIEAHHVGLNKKTWTYAEAREGGVAAHRINNPQCSEECTRTQLDAYHKSRCGMDDKTPLRLDPQAGTRSRGRLNPDQMKELKEELAGLKKVRTGSK